MYTQVFGGNTVQPASPSYTQFLNVVADLNLTWPIQFIDSLNVIANIIDISTAVGGLNVNFSSAQNVSPGQTVLINNIGANAFTVRDATGGAIVAIAAGTSWFIYLTNNTTDAGVWRTVPFAGGVAAVTFVGAVSNTPNITIAGSPIVNAGTFTFDLGATLAAIAAIGAGGPNGFLVQTGIDTWASRTFIPGANVNIINASGLLGNPTIALNNNINVTQANIGNIQIAANTISTTNLNGDLDLSPNGTGNTVINSNADVHFGNSLRLFNGANAFFTGLTTAPGLAGNTTFQLPLSDGTNGQAIVTNGAAALSFASVSGFPSGPGTSTLNALARFSDVNGDIKNSGVILSDLNGLSGIATAAIGNLTFAVNTIGSTGNILINPANNSIVAITQNGAPPSMLVLYNTAITNYIGFRVDPALAATTNYLLPNDGAAGQYLMTNGAANLTWQAPVRAWAVVTGNTGVALSAFGCVVARAAAGLYNVVLTTPFATANYAITAQVNGTNDGVGATFFIINYYNQANNSFLLKVVNNAGVLTDPATFSFMAVG